MPEPEPKSQLKPKPPPDPQQELRDELQHLNLPNGMIDDFMKPHPNSHYSHVREAVANGDYGNQAHLLLEEKYIREVAVEEYERLIRERFGAGPNDRPISKVERTERKRLARNARAQERRLRKSRGYCERVVEIRATPSEQQLFSPRPWQTSQEVSVGKNREEWTQGENADLEADLSEAFDLAVECDASSLDEDQEMTDADDGE